MILTRKPFAIVYTQVLNKSSSSSYGILKQSYSAALVYRLKGKIKQFSLRGKNKKGRLIQVAFGVNQDNGSTFRIKKTYFIVL